MANVSLSRFEPMSRVTASRSGTVAEFVAQIAPDWHSDWAWANYENTITRMVRQFGFGELCEIGGGRDPTFSLERMAALGARLTINDISQEELDWAPHGFPTACFDVAGDFTAAGIKPESYDLMFSKMVFEHIPNVEAAWTNVHKLLKPGGMGLAFFPTLYALPFAVNHLIPEKLSRAILHTMRRERSDDGKDPKFPAIYDWCYGSQNKLAPMLQRAGFKDFAVVPFWGYGYLERIPVARELDHAFNRVVAAARWKTLTSYAFVIVRKS